MDRQASLISSVRRVGAGVGYIKTYKNFAHFRARVPLTRRAMRSLANILTERKIRANDKNLCNN